MNRKQPFIWVSLFFTFFLIQVTLKAQEPIILDSKMKPGISNDMRIEELKVRWKKAALENCPGVPCVTATVPAAPTAVVATAGNASVGVAFVAPTNNGGSTITGYTVRSNPGNITATGTTSPINVTGLTNGTPYTFTVVATNAIGNSVASAASTAVTPVAPNTVPGPPTSVVATAGNASASVAFVAPANNGGSAITGYTVTSNPGGITATGGATSTSINVTGLTNGTPYTFTVVATNAIGNSVASSASTAVTPVAPNTVPGAPTSVVATAGNASASVVFVAPTNNGGSAITGYTVTSSPGGITATGGATSTSINVTGLTNGTPYTFTVVATNAIGNSVASAASTAVTPVAPNTVPGPPTSVVATAGNLSASVAFVAPASNGGSAITGYTVTSSPGGITATGTTSTSPINVTGLANGTAYTFTVVAMNAVGNSVPSAASAAVTPAAVPGAPTIVSVVSGNTQAIVSFTGPSSTGGSAITGYTVTSNPATSPVMGTTSPITVTGLANGTAYTFTVVATNAVGNSVASASSAAVTPATVPGAPIIVSAVSGNTQAIVNFTAPSSTGGSAITGYTVTSNPATSTVTGTTSPITVTGLANGTAYTFSIVATNAVGNSVASAASTAVTPAVCPTSTVTDVDGNIYNTVAIGTQCWTKENLKVTKYNNNDIIPDSSNSTWGTAAIGARTDYVGVSGYVGTYGYLYNWYAATDSRNICPTGYHVPTDSEWNKLVKFIDSGADTSSTSTTQSTTAGGEMKTAGTNYWNFPSTGTNASGFSAKGGGFRRSDVGNPLHGMVDNLNINGFFWSTTTYDLNNQEALFRLLIFAFDGVVRTRTEKRYGASIRCVKD